MKGLPREHTSFRVAFSCMPAAKKYGARSPRCVCLLVYLHAALRLRISVFVCLCLMSLHLWLPLSACPTLSLLSVPMLVQVMIQYTTKTCAEYYTQHGREWPQVCGDGVFLVAASVLACRKSRALLFPPALARKCCPKSRTRTGPDCATGLGLHCGNSCATAQWVF